MRLSSVRPGLCGLVLALAAVTACGGRPNKISGTRIADNAANRRIIDTVEAYRRAVEDTDAAALLLMASPRYWEDSGTPSGSDDYGVDGLQAVLSGRFKKATDVRYSMRYVSIRRACPGGRDPDDLVPECRAHVEVLIDASYTIIDARGMERRPDKRDQNELVLEWTCGTSQGCKWLFVSGM